MKSPYWVRVEAEDPELLLHCVWRALRSPRGCWVWTSDENTELSTKRGCWQYSESDRGRGWE